MEGAEYTKVALLRILQILEYKSDIDHPLNATAIAKELESVYGIVLERKAIGRNLEVLRNVGYEIKTTNRGSYLETRKFEDSELRLLIDGVLSSRHIVAKHSRDLIEKLSGLSNKYFKSHIKNVYAVDDWYKTENASLFYNIEIIDEAIEKGKRVKFNYNRYGADKKLHCTSKHMHVVSPYQMIVRNQHYFLIARNEYWGDVTFYRLDKITDIGLTKDSATPLKDNKGYENGIDYKKVASAFPYMYADDIETVTFYIKGEWMVDQVVDWFGYDFQITQEDDRYVVTVQASPSAMEYWLMQYLNNAEVISPASLRETVAKNISVANDKYNRKD